MSNAATSL